ncbi:helix-turn-helix transcriptional regulator [Rhizobium sp. 2MFCol3.1]|uniref:helix-turn-helix domain-containing protein n=1 Tax=Rhizobium sp. 2MFCol3.1 TaxID=1246459 RepID=UPI00037995FF|nr:helix-turn-helix transcriptional regulator [Rhizobium sp. 2MFCol3.1]
MRRSQRDVAEDAGISQKTLSELENHQASLIDKNLQLVDFYASKGIEFVGEAQVGKPVRHAGAKWAAPNGPDATDAQKAKFRSEDQPVSFGAARALLQKHQSYVAAAIGVSNPTVQNLENSYTRSPVSERLKLWYEEQGVVFTGWGDVKSGRFYGVGVRWADRGEE